MEYGHEVGRFLSVEYEAAIGRGLLGGFCQEPSKEGDEGVSALDELTVALEERHELMQLEGRHLHSKSFVSVIRRHF